MPENNYDWSRFTLKVNISSDVASIYQSFTSKNQLEHWFLRRADITGNDGNLKGPHDEIVTGDNYQWFWHGYSDADIEKGSFKEVNGKDKIVFTFGLAGNVSISINKFDNYCIVELRQEDIPVSDEGKIHYHLGCTKGWQFYLINLKSLLEGGIDLRNKNESIKGVITS